MNQVPAKLAVPLAPLVPRLELDGDGEKAIAGADSASAGVDRLVAAGRHQDAVKLLAHALPKREAVWWACMCARAIPDAALPPEDAAAIEAAETWVRLLGGAIIALIVVALVYTGVIGLLNLSRIGV